MGRVPQRSPLALVQGTDFDPKIMQYSDSKDANPIGRPDLNSQSLDKKNSMKENSHPNGITLRYNECVVADKNKLSLTPRFASLEEDASNLLTKLQASYQISRSILQEISKEKAAMDISPTKPFSEDCQDMNFEEVSTYCDEKRFNRDNKVEIKTIKDVSPRCADKTEILVINTEVETLRKEKQCLLSENNELQEQIAFQSACQIQAEAYLASMTKLLKDKEAALEQYDEFIEMNNASNVKIVKEIKKQYEQQIIGMNEKVQCSSSQVKELENKMKALEETLVNYKGMCRLKDRQLESSVVTAANLERSEKEISDLQMITKTQSKRIEYLSSLNDEINEVISSLTAMLHEKEKVIDDWINFSKMNEEASKKLFMHIGKKHQEELQETNDKINGLLSLIERQQFSDNEYLRLQLRGKARLKVEFDAMKLRLDSYILDDHLLSEFHSLIGVITLSSGFLLLYWSYVVIGC